MTAQKTILIVHASVGSGHKSAALAIAKAFEVIDEQSERETGDEEAPYAIEVLDILDFGKVKFDGNNTASMFTGWGRPFYDLTWRFTLTGRLLWGGGTIWARLMFSRFVDYVREKKPAAIIATHITAANAAVSARMLTGETFPIVCVPTDYEIEGLWPHLSTDLFCVADERMAETLRPRRVPESRIRVTGIPAAPTFSMKYDRTEMRREFQLPDDKQVVLFLAGATLPRPYMHFRNSLREMLPYMHAFDDMEIVVVAGKDAEYAEETRRYVKQLGLVNVRVLDFVTNMPGLMASADLIVCKPGGLTVTECLCIGTPMVLLGRAYGQEKSNVTMLTSTGAAYHVTTWRELLDILRQINEHPRMTDGILVNASLIRRPDAAMEVAEATIELLGAKPDPTNPLYNRRFIRFYWGGKPAHTR